MTNASCPGCRNITRVKRVSSNGYGEMGNIPATLDQLTERLGNPSIDKFGGMEWAVRSGDQEFWIAEDPFQTGTRNDGLYNWKLYAKVKRPTRVAISVDPEQFIRDLGLPIAFLPIQRGADVDKSPWNKSKGFEAKVYNPASKKFKKMRWNVNDTYYEGGPYHTHHKRWWGEVK